MKPFQPIRLALVFLAATLAACSRAPEPATPATSAPPAAEAVAATHATLVEREAAFATAARDRGVKAAFLEFLGEDSIVLQPGPVWGRAAWTVRKEVTAKLEWVPDRAQLAASGDFGFTTGPWLLTPADPAAGKAEGRYFTVWRQTAGGWRVLFDGGFGREPAGAWDRRTDRPALGMHACVSGESMPPGELQILDLGMSGIPGGETHAIRAGRQLAATAELCHPPSVEGAADDAARNTALAALPQTLQYWPMGAAIAGSGDLGYSYGLSAPAPGASANAAYVHVWCRQADGWRLALQLRSDFPPG
jgi:ketosteroid isomerase-like protein